MYVRQPLLVVFKIAVERFDFAAVYQVEIVGGGADQVAIVRHDNQCAFELNQRFGQRLTHVEIQVVGRFIEQQQVGSLPDDQRQHQTRFFAARETLGVFGHLIALEAEAAEVVAQLLLHLLRRKTRQMLNRGFIRA